MKTKYCLAILLLSIMTMASSQSFKGGVLGGLNAARIDNDGDELYGKLGLNAGAFVSRDILPDMLEWQLELKYTSRGKYDINRDLSGNVIGILLIDIRYIELPVSLQFKPNEKIQIGLGLSPDVLIKEAYFDQDGPLPDDKDLRRYGITAFAEFNYFILQPLALGVRFNYSVFPFYKFDGYAIRYRNTGYFHDVLSINLKYYFIRK